MTYNNKQKTEQSKTAVIIVRYYNMDRHELFQDNYHGLNKGQKKQTERTFKNLQSTDTDLTTLGTQDKTDTGLATLGTQDKNRHGPDNIGTQDKTDTGLATLSTQDKNRHWPGNIGYTR